mmetsp:Transcript_1038/g.3274  ORF Transcript_1038/g.3274 Transcript_1038/m.3274 type:complete len:218 (-) Transcript_1038:13-666(-)
MECYGTSGREYSPSESGRVALALLLRRGPCVSSVRGCSRPPGSMERCGCMRGASSSSGGATCGGGGALCFLDFFFFFGAAPGSAGASRFRFLRAGAGARAASSIRAYSSRCLWNAAVASVSKAAVALDAAVVDGPGSTCIGTLPSTMSGAAVGLPCARSAGKFATSASTSWSTGFILLKACSAVVARDSQHLDEHFRWLHTKAVAEKRRHRHRRPPK